MKPLRSRRLFRFLPQCTDYVSAIGRILAPTNENILPNLFFLGNTYGMQFAYFYGTQFDALFHRLHSFFGARFDFFLDRDLHFPGAICLQECTFLMMRNEFIRFCDITVHIRGKCMDRSTFSTRMRVSMMSIGRGE